ncbi:methylmalonyl-CoA mutase subunit beta [Bacillus sp. cl95]|uniref:methylmalonyl-CoA mutase subunit beta n=2 Tax=unclassified Bacillus (in: firmicutes) TaxID=185979 RepID=UPI0020C8EC2E|nr:methylmalonyl-CoA mutase subunit beta [Bacillus sp. cl95]
MKQTTFEEASYEKWQEKAEATLKGRKIDSLDTNTYENIVLKPLYSEEDGARNGYPGIEDFRRGSGILGYVASSWKIAQDILFHSIDDLNEKLNRVFSKGQTAISFDVNEELFSSEKELAAVLIKHVAQYPLAIDAKGLQPAFLSILLKAAIDEGVTEKVSGYVGFDPLTIMAEAGTIPEDHSLLLDQWCKNIQYAGQQLPNLRTVLVDTAAYNNTGANAVQELAVAIAMGSYYIEKLLEHGMQLNEILEKFIFKFSIGSNFFMEVAKLRAARILWNKISEAYGAQIDRGMEITAETSRMNKSLLDSRVNMLRAGNEAFAAVLGGVQYLKVGSYDELSKSSEIGERLARNTQWILKDEVHLQKVIDPAGGSWYIENLTEELAEKAWAKFQNIDAQGGILEVLKSETLQKDIALVRQQRAKDVLNRKKSIVGTNVYANLDEKVSQEILKPCGHLYTNVSLEELLLELEQGNGISHLLKKKKNSAGNTFQALKGIRLSRPFEEMRQKARNLALNNGCDPTVGLLCLGELKEYKPRTDFVRGFLTAGGVKVTLSESNLSLEEAKSFIEKSNTEHFCLCGSDETYRTFGVQLVEKLKQSYPEKTFYLAGLPTAEDQAVWLEKGIKQFIHLKSNCYESLLTLLTEMGAEVHEE